jgi:hypothetical protein
MEPTSGQAPRLQLIVPNRKTAGKKKLKARDVPPEIRELVARDFRVLKDSAVVAERWGYPRAVVHDILHLHNGDSLVTAQRATCSAREMVSMMREQRTA